MQKMGGLPHRILQFYEKHEQTRLGGLISVLWFVLGYAFNSLSPNRIDLLWDNIKLLCYIGLGAACIVITHLIENGFLKTTFFARHKGWYPIGVNFFIGGLFSSHVIYYFQSSSGIRSFFFIMILIIISIASEFFKKRLSHLYLEFSLFFLANFSFSVFFLPIFTKEMNRATFVKGGLISLAFTIFLLAFVSLRKKNSKAPEKPFFKTAAVLIGLFVSMNGLYFLNWIPPVPLALKHVGVYHEVRRQGESYSLKYEQSDAYSFWNQSTTQFHFADGDTVYCFAAVFAPTALNKQIFHIWKQYIAEKGEWLTQDRLGYELHGGRDGGYRGYSSKNIITIGSWRIEIVTEDDLLLGSVDFEVVKAQNPEDRKFKTILR